MPFLGSLLALLARCIFVIAEISAIILVGSDDTHQQFQAYRVPTYSVLCAPRDDIKLTIDSNHDLAPT